MATGIGQRRTVLIMYCISAIMGMVSIMVVKRELVEAVVLTVVAAVLLCVFVADHPRLRDIMQEGISAVPKSREPQKEKTAPDGETEPSEDKGTAENSGEAPVQEDSAEHDAEADDPDSAAQQGEGEVQR